MSPKVAKAFDKDIATHLDILEELFVVRQGSARLTMDLWELDVFEQLGCVQDVLEPGKGIVEVPHLGPKQDKISF